MVESGYVAEGDHKTMAKAIKDRVSLIRWKREQRQLLETEESDADLHQRLLYQQRSLSLISEGVLDSGQGSTVFSSESPHPAQPNMSYSSPPSTPYPPQPQPPYPATPSTAQQQHPGYPQPPQQMPSSHCRRGRSMSVCVPSPSYSSYSSFPHAPLHLAAPPAPTPPADPSYAPPPRGPLPSERASFAGRLSTALETVLPLHSPPALPRPRQRRASLPALCCLPVGPGPPAHPPTPPSPGARSGGNQGWVGFSFSTEREGREETERVCLKG
ncbi:unnamed protein product [Boreogadus saida]